MSSTLFSRGVTSQMGSKARADRIDADIHNLKVAAGEILGLKRAAEAQTAQIAALEAALKDQQTAHEQQIKDLHAVITSLEERVKLTETIVSAIQKVLPVSF